MIALPDGEKRYLRGQHRRRERGYHGDEERDAARFLNVVPPVAGGLGLCVDCRRGGLFFSVYPFVFVIGHLLDPFVLYVGNNELTDAGMAPRPFYLFLIFVRPSRPFFSVC